MGGPSHPMVVVPPCNHIKQRTIKIHVFINHIHIHIHIHIQRHLLHLAPASGCLGIHTYRACRIIHYNHCTHHSGPILNASFLNIRRYLLCSNASSYTIRSVPSGGTPYRITFLCSCGTRLVKYMIHAVWGCWCFLP